MQIYETPKFTKLREKLKSTDEKQQLKKAILSQTHNPESGKKLKGEFKEFRSYRYTFKGQDRRLIYKIKNDHIYLLSFGPREGIYG